MLCLAVCLFVRVKKSVMVDLFDSLVVSCRVCVRVRVSRWSKCGLHIGRKGVVDRVAVAFWFHMG